MGASWSVEPGSNDSTTKGPDPIGSWKKPASAAVCGVTKNEEILPRNAASGAGAVKATVRSSGAATVYPPKLPASGPSPARTRSNDATTSAAVTGVPSENSTPSRSVNVQTLVSALGSHDSASSPSNSPGPVLTSSWLKIARAASWVPASWLAGPCGSRFSIGSGPATVRSPPVALESPVGDDESSDEQAAAAVSNATVPATTAIERRVWSVMTDPFVSGGASPACA